MPALLYVMAVAAGLAGAAVGVSGMLGTAWTLRVGAVVPLGGLELTLDPLAGLFLAVVGVSTAVVSLYAIGEPQDKHYDTGVAYLGFVGALAVVPLAANAMTFLIAWEVMSLASWMLVLDRRDDAQARRAAWVYAVMTHAGLACLLAGMLLLGAETGSLRFADWRAAAPGLAPGFRHAVWLLLALGFAGKAGVIPLHVWLPLAHPAAPSHVSALMSGVMIKLGIYGLLRIGFDWLGAPPPGWGIAMLLAGVVSALVGILYALVDHDLKRLLAFCSIENVGIILIGVGGAMVFHQAGLSSLAILALVAALYHAVNHAMFKALLFLAAGAVVHGTGTRNMEAMGGLIKRMPWTAACFLLGSAAIAGLPPLNGFVSEWLTFQALLQNLHLESPALNLLFVVAIAALALTGGLAAACFVKAFGITFLALPRSEAATTAHEATPAMQAAMLGLALACVALGLGPTLVVPVIGGIAAGLLGAAPPLAWGSATTLEVSGSFARLSTVAIAGAVVVGAAAPALALAVGGISRRRRLYETWGCGRMLQTARMEYTAAAFADPFKRVFRFFYRPVRRLDIDVHPESRFFVRRMEYANPVRSLFEEWLYRPALSVLRAVVAGVHHLQSGSASAYLTYIFVVLLVLLALR
jgi:hydrogenase-4 component B